MSKQHLCRMCHERPIPIGKDTVAVRARGWGICLACFETPQNQRRRNAELRQLNMDRGGQ